MRFRKPFCKILHRLDPGLVLFSGLLIFHLLDIDQEVDQLLLTQLPVHLR
jgi:hypothetical protein